MRTDFIANNQENPKNADTPRLAWPFFMRLQ